MTPQGEAELYRLEVYNQKGEGRLLFLTGGYEAVNVVYLVQWLGGKVTLTHGTPSQLCEGDKT